MSNFIHPSNFQGCKSYKPINMDLVITYNANQTIFGNHEIVFDTVKGIRKWKFKNIGYLRKARIKLEKI